MVPQKYTRRITGKKIIASCAVGVTAALTYGTGLASAHPLPTTLTSAVAPGQTSPSPAATADRTRAGIPSAQATRTPTPTKSAPTVGRAGTGPRPAAPAPLVATLTTVASPSVVLGSGGQVFDTATLSGGVNNPTGTITFVLFRPGDTTCSRAPVFDSTVPVSGNGIYPSRSFRPTTAGTYRWVAWYSGDLNNVSVSTTCNDPGESVDVTPARTSLRMMLSRDVTLGGQVSSTAILTGGVDPLGLIMLRLFGPGDTTCSRAPTFSDNIPVFGNGRYDAGPFIPTAAGTYRWTASYNGNANNLPASTTCNDPGTTVEVLPAPTSLRTTASPSVALGGQVSDTATLTDGVNPTGTITFLLFGPGDPTCSNPPPFRSEITVSGNGDYTSTPFTPDAGGTYRWTASYNGDPNNSPASTTCNDPGASVSVTPVPVSLRTTASPSVTLGGQVSATATLTDGVNPTGTTTFLLFGPEDETCSGPPVFTSTVPVSDNGSYTSAPFIPTSVGAYRWTVSYTGDANNSPASTTCGDPDGSVVVTAELPVTGTDVRFLTSLGAGLLTLGWLLTVVTRRGSRQRLARPRSCTS
ncbi:Ig-like domain-containing protein [Micromonospora pisi]|uniref:Ig-like domain-containing protein n=1 Tax=Micromonospora pisi TaxID=589240 RepID=A0A495JS25_9ACTN|nr:Ig-like domain-containing protein [Micromonospora pisi]